MAPQTGSNKKTIIIPRENAVFRMDGNGIWHNEHGRFEHPKIISHFNRSIQKDSQGYFLSQMIDESREEKVYFPYEDTALFIVDIRSCNNTIDLVLNTAQRLSLDPKTLFIKDDNLFLRTTDHLIKFNQQALTKIARHLDETDRGMVLNMGGRTFPIPEQ